MCHMIKTSVFCSHLYHCMLYLHRGLASATWGQGCSMEAGGWQGSSKDSCGATAYPWVPFALPHVHWDMVQRALEGPS